MQESLPEKEEKLRKQQRFEEMNRPPRVDVVAMF